METIMVTPEESALEQVNSYELYIIQNINSDSTPVKLIYNKENNILYEDTYNNKDSA